MKKILISIVLILTIGLFNSCNDLLNVEQPGQLTDQEAFSSVTTLKQTLNGLYAAFAYENVINFQSVFTDEISIGFSNGGQGLNDGLFSYVLNTNTPLVSRIWLTYHRAINLANRIIINAPNVPTNSLAEEDEVKDVIAQARALRALAYLILISHFSPNLSDNNALGAILFTNVPSAGTKLPRSTNGDIYNLIYDDLNYAENNISTTATSVTRITLRAIRAIRARAACYQGNYTLAEQQADLLISSMNLATRAQYGGVWADTNNAEIIFKLERTIGDSRVGSIWASVDASVSGNAWFEMGRALFNLMYQAGAPINNASPASTPPTGQSDVRCNVFVHSSSIISPTYSTDPNPLVSDQITINKYRGSEGQNLLNDIKMFRLSEMYFIKAEAQIAQNNLTGAATTLNTLRNLRISPTPPPISFSNATTAYQALLRERRVELCYEGFRYTDIKRLGVLAGVSFDRDPVDCNINNSCSFSNTDHRLTMPIPIDEIIANPTIQQNPGY